MPVTNVAKTRGLFILTLTLLLAVLALWVGNSPAGALPPSPSGGSGVIARVSVKSSGGEGNANSFLSTISSDGRYVAFQSHATNLVLGDTNSRQDAFLHDRRTGATERVSVAIFGGEGNQDSSFPNISSDGRYVSFLSSATNLVVGDTNFRFDVFVYDRQKGVTERVSVDSFGREGNGDSLSASISSDGRYVAFGATSFNLVGGDTNGRRDIFVHDRQTGATERVSVDSLGGESNGSSEGPSISSDGRYVAFYSSASNLVTGDANNVTDVFAHDRQTGVTERVSEDLSGGDSNGLSRSPTISSGGRYVAFVSVASDLVASDTNGVQDVFVYDRQTGATELVSVDSLGREGNTSSSRPSISADGRYVSFDSAASNLVAGDTKQRYRRVRTRPADGGDGAGVGGLLGP